MTTPTAPVRTLEVDEEPTARSRYDAGHADATM